jgi:hypothetical protein
VQCPVISAEQTGRLIMLPSGTGHGARITLVTAGVPVVRPNEMRTGNAVRVSCWWTWRANESMSGVWRRSTVSHRSQPGDPR